MNRIYFAVIVSTHTPLAGVIIAVACPELSSGDQDGESRAFDVGLDVYLLNRQLWTAEDT